MTAFGNQDLAALLRMFEESSWREMELDFKGEKVFLSKDGGKHASWATGTPAAPAAAAPPAAPTATAAPAPAVAATTIGTTSLVIPAGHVAVSTPSLGTFYRAAKPGAEPMVSIGQQVTPDTELCLIEVMKLFTTVRAGVSGVVRDILVPDGTMVEHDQPLFLIETNG